MSLTEWSASLRRAPTQQMGSRGIPVFILNSPIDGANTRRAKVHWRKAANCSGANSRSFVILRPLAPSQNE
jgi:hypothetical protein